MQIYLNIFKKSKIINYKDNIFLLKLNNFLIFQFFSYLLLCLFFFNSNKLTKLLILSLLKKNLVNKINFNAISNLFFSNIFLITQIFQSCTFWKKTKKIIYPVLKSPFIYKKAFRHFFYIEYQQQIQYRGKFIYFWSFLNLNPLKFELTNSIKSIQIIENQTFTIC